jgi:hypothetical protein
MNSFEVPEQACPVCGKLQNRVSSAMPGSEQGPAPGDYAICFNCKEFLVYDEQLIRRKPTPEQLAALNPRFQNMMIRLRGAFQSSSRAN